MATSAEEVRYGRAPAVGRPLPGPAAGHPVRIIEYTLTVTTARIPGTPWPGLA